ncbi:helix-turn-helix domain-containing protein [Viridibacillus sp. NPDC093762]|uniref:helix-turn-helix domain-containing protein n=1 Tax=Viridibacillus sp. NPDC093762 TaxID=3390720 RepID=UPI003CFF46D6
MKLGNRIKRIRLLKGLKQADICHGIISPTHYSNIENCRYTPSIDTLKLLAGRLEVPERYFHNIYEDTTEMQNILSTLETKIEKESVEEVRQFLDLHQDQFRYIASIRQEFYFLLLKFLALVKMDEYDIAFKLYENEIATVDIDESQLYVATRQLYSYVTAVYHFYIGNYKKSVEYFKKILQLHEDPYMIARTSFNLALSHYHLCLFERCLKYAKDAKDIYLSLHEWDKVGDCYNIISISYRELHEYNEAEAYIEKGFNICREDFSSLKSLLHHNYALVLLDKKQFEDALIQVNKSIKIKKTLDYSDIFVSLNLRLEIYLELDEILELRANLQTLKSHIRNNKNEASFLLLNAMLEYKSGNLSDYEEFICASIEIFKRHTDLKQMKIATEHYANYLAMNKKYKKAFEMQLLCTECLKKHLGEI